MSTLQKIILSTVLSVVTLMANEIQVFSSNTMRLPINKDSKVKNLYIGSAENFYKNAKNIFKDKSVTSAVFTNIQNTMLTNVPSNSLATTEHVNINDSGESMGTGLKDNPVTSAVFASGQNAMLTNIQSNSLATTGHVDTNGLGESMGIGLAVGLFAYATASSIQWFVKDNEYISVNLITNKFLESTILYIYIVANNSLNDSELKEISNNKIKALEEGN